MWNLNLWKTTGRRESSLFAKDYSEITKQNSNMIIGYNEILTWERLFFVLNGKSDCECLSFLLFSLGYHLSYFLSTRGTFIGSMDHGYFNKRIICTLWFSHNGEDSALDCGSDTVTFSNNPHWSRGHCNVWNVWWSGGITNFINVDGINGVGCSGRPT